MKPVAIATAGPGPFELPFTQSGTAAGNQKTVAMTLLSATDDTTQELKRVSTQMASGVARDLAIRLWLAAEASEVEA